jgi:hypothetical protein
MSLAVTFGVDLSPAKAGDYASTGCPDGHETQLSFLDRTEPETLAHVDFTMPDALHREEAWPVASSAALGLPVLMVVAPPVWIRTHGVFEVMAFAYTRGKTMRLQDLFPDGLAFDLIDF